MKKTAFIFLNLFIAASLYIFPFNVYSVIASSNDSVSDDRHHRERGDYDTSRDDRGDIDNYEKEHEREHDREDVDRDKHDRDRDDREGDRDSDREGAEREGGHSDDRRDSDTHDSKEDMKSHYN